MIKIRVIRLIVEDLKSISVEIFGMRFNDPSADYIDRPSCEATNDPYKT